MLYYEIYDTQTRNLLIDAGTLAEVLDVVRAMVRERRAAAVETWLLIEDDDTDPEKGRRIADGEDLARLAMTATQELATPHDD
jgi:hypothetical protein